LVKIEFLKILLKVVKIYEVRNTIYENPGEVELIFKVKAFWLQKNRNFAFGPIRELNTDINSSINASNTINSINFVTQ